MAARLGLLPYLLLCSKAAHSSKFPLHKVNVRIKRVRPLIHQAASRSLLVDDFYLSPVVYFKVPVAMTPHSFRRRECPQRGLYTSALLLGHVDNNSSM